MKKIKGDYLMVTLDFFSYRANAQKLTLEKIKIEVQIVLFRVLEYTRQQFDAVLRR